MSRTIRTAAIAMALVLLAGCTATPTVAEVPPPAGTTTPPTPPTPAPDSPKPVACTDPRPQLCTMEYAPVCATRDTGIRCVTAPCPSSELKTYSTGCTACSDPKVSSWVKGACPGG